MDDKERSGTPCLAIGLTTTGLTNSGDGGGGGVEAGGVVVEFSLVDRN